MCARAIFEAHDAVLVNMNGDMVVKNFSFVCLPKDIEDNKRR
jgi:hypothetical protein